jgi:hypothetical protein
VEFGSLHTGYCAAVGFGRVACILTCVAGISPRCDVTGRHLEGRRRGDFVYERDPFIGQCRNGGGSGDIRKVSTD